MPHSVISLHIPRNQQTRNYRSSKMRCHHFRFLCDPSYDLAKWAFVIFGCLVLCWLLVTTKDKHNRVTSVECGNDPVDYLTRNNFVLTEKSAFVNKYKSQKNYNKHVPCRSSVVHQFTVEETVRCFDSLAVQRQRRPMHIAFIGDSTIRQHFLNLLKLFPDYDLETIPDPRISYPYPYHKDRNVTYPLLDNLLISYRRRYRIDSELITDLKRWAMTENERDPDVIIIGLTLHHVMNVLNNPTSLDSYEKMLRGDVVPYLTQSQSRRPNQKIIWLHQSFTMDLIGPIGADEAERNILSDSIRTFNKRIRRIFRDTKVVMWDSVNPIVEEYLRACALTQVDREDRAEYQDCKDFVHPGFGALSIASHLLLNYICTPVA